ncbi:hypothetical protein CfE428DRAFT_0778 [Chthoniobacter flavus Ellin428]|uniref:Uncharacterized protein n=1 Tax=Chthoniobacter flavus Ellin428 TaxID=497964 RepID=B4CVU1_9BACT|nr:hypothetical protein [Chthoniobacter flavus]EDY21533.1 hypothetical protein CfE428DRAFT_0778 [Chthoniobacter flavus Ellin428]
MITPLLQTALEPVITRHRQLRALRWLVLGLALLTLGVAVVITRGTAIPAKALLATLCGAVIFLIARVLGRLWQPDFRNIARRIEEQHPELHALLITRSRAEARSQNRQVQFPPAASRAAGRCGKPQIELAGCGAGLASVESSPDRLPLCPSPRSG